MQILLPEEMSRGGDSASELDNEQDSLTAFEIKVSGVSTCWSLAGTHFEHLLLSMELIVFFFFLTF